MKKFIAISTLVAAIGVSPVFAQVVTVEFDTGEGALTYNFDHSNNTWTTPDGRTGEFTMSAANKQVCADDVCATFEEILPPEETETGFTTAFTADNGTSGTATVISVE